MGGIISRHIIAQRIFFKPFPLIYHASNQYVTLMQFLSNSYDVIRI